MKRNKQVSLLILASFIFCSGLVGSLGAAEFSADVVQTVQGKTYDGKAFIKGQLIRTEMIKNGQESIIINDLDKKTSYILSPKTKTYMEMKLVGEMTAAAASEEARQKLGQWKSLGTEKVNGYMCEKKLLIFKDKSWGESTSWFAIKLNYPIKTFHQSKHGEVNVEYQNIKEGKISDSLFKIPPGYKKQEMPSFGGMKIPGMGGKTSAPSSSDEGNEEEESD